MNLENQDPYTLPILKEINERLVDTQSQITSTIGIDQFDITHFVGKFAVELKEYVEAAAKFSTSVRGAIAASGASVPLSVLQTNSIDYMALINARIVWKCPTCSNLLEWCRRAKSGLFTSCEESGTSTALREGETRATEHCSTIARYEPQTFGNDTSKIDHNE